MGVKGAKRSFYPRAKKNVGRPVVSRKRNCPPVGPGSPGSPGSFAAGLSQGCLRCFESSPQLSRWQPPDGRWVGRPTKKSIRTKVRVVPSVVPPSFLFLALPLLTCRLVHSCRRRRWWPSMRPMPRRAAIYARAVLNKVNLMPVKRTHTRKVMDLKGFQDSFAHATWSVKDMQDLKKKKNNFMTLYYGFCQFFIIRCTINGV